MAQYPFLWAVRLTQGVPSHTADPSTHTLLSAQNEEGVVVVVVGVLVVVPPPPPRQTLQAVILKASLRDCVGGGVGDEGPVDIFFLSCLLYV